MRIVHFHDLRIVLALICAFCVLVPTASFAAPTQPAIAPAIPEALDFNGTTLAPMEIAAKALGANVVMTADDIQATLPNGNSITVKPNGTPEADNPTDVTAKLKPVTIGETVYVQLKPLVEELGAKLEQDTAKGTATITLPGKEPKTVAMLVIPVATPVNQFSEDGVELYAITLSNRNQLRLSYGLAGSMQFALTADGKRIVYTRSGNLYRRELSSPIPNLVLGVSKDKLVFYSDPNVTPDGATIYCSRHTFNMNTQQLTTDLIRVAADGTKPREWPGLACPRLSPDGKTLVYTRFAENGPNTLGILDTQKETLREIGEGYHPVYSADGVQFAFTKPYKNAQGALSWVVATYEVAGVRAGTLHEMPAAQRTGKQTAGGFSTDGKRVVFEDAGKGIFLASADLVTVRQLTSKPRDNRPMISVDGTTVFFVRDGNIYTMNIEKGGEKFLSSGLAIIDYRSAADGKTLFCTANPIMTMGPVDDPFPPAPVDFPPIVDVPAPAPAK